MVGAAVVGVDVCADGWADVGMDAGADVGADVGLPVGELAVTRAAVFATAASTTGVDVVMGNHGVLADLGSRGTSGETVS